MLKKILQGCLIGLVAAAAAALLWASGALTHFEAKTWDWRVIHLAQPRAATDKIRLIFIDQYSLDWANKEMGLKWPWPREIYKPILDFCRRQGARAVIFDMLYTEPSYMGVEDDRAFGSAIAETSNFVGAIFLGQGGNSTNWPVDLALPPELLGLRPWQTVVNYRHAIMPSATFPIPEVATNVGMFGNVQASPDADAIFRQLELFSVFDGRAIPCLGLAAYLVAAPSVALSIKAGVLHVGEHVIPIDQCGRALLNFRGPAGTHRRFTAAAVIQSELQLQEGKLPTIQDAQAFRDCYVFLGCNAPGLLDLRPTPFSRVYPGMEIYATALDNLLANDFMRHAAHGITLLCVLVMALLTSTLIRIGRTARANILVFGLILPLPLVLCVGAYQQGLWLPLLVQEAAIIMALLGGLLVNYATEGRQKRFIRGAFKQYLSAEVIDQLVQSPERLTLGGEQRRLSIFFSDLQGFTSIAETLSPAELTALLNDYLSAMTDIIQAEGGTIDKYEGDAIIAFWNAPLAQDDHARRALRAALRCQNKLAEMRPALRRRAGQDLFMRIGLNTGAAIVGNMGSRNRFNYTILGDAANLAARLEGLNKLFGTYTLIAEATRAEAALSRSLGSSAAAAPLFAFREISQVVVVGRKAAVRVFEPMEQEVFAARRKDFELFAQGLAAYYGGDFKAALSSFTALQDKDPPAAAYARQCRHLIAHPPINWAGVWVVTEK